MPTQSVVYCRAGTGGSVSSASMSGDSGSTVVLSGNVATASWAQYGSPCTATPNDGYAFDHWEYSSTESGNRTTAPDGSYSLSGMYLWAIFVEAPAGQDINLTAGHDYIVTSAGSVSSASLSGNVLTIANESKIDVIDLGAGTRGGGPVVLLVCAEGYASSPDFVMQGGGGGNMIDLYIKSNTSQSNVTVKIIDCSTGTTISTFTINSVSGNDTYVNFGQIEMPDGGIRIELYGADVFDGRVRMYHDLITEVSPDSFSASLQAYVWENYTVPSDTESLGFYLYWYNNGPK